MAGHDGNLPPAGRPTERGRRACLCAKRECRAFKIFDLELGHLERIQVLMDKYRELPLNLADGSLVILAEELGSGRILSTDQRDFRTYRSKTRKPFRIFWCSDRATTVPTIATGRSP